MSASKEKRNRTDARQSGSDKKIEKNKKLEQQRKRVKAISVIVAVVLVVLIASAVVINTGVLYGATAVSIDSKDYDVTEFNYQYFSTFYSTYNNLYESLGSYVSYFLNPNLSLSAQKCAYDSEKTWDQYFTETAINHLKEVTAITAAAQAAGYTLDADAKKEIDDTVASVAKNAQEAGYVSMKKYLVANYGKGMTEAKFKENLERESLVTKYAKSVYDGYEYGSDEIKAYYQEHKDEYDPTSFYYYFVSGAAVKEDADKGIEAVDSETAMANAKALADKIAAATTPEEFTKAIYDSLGEEERKPYEDTDYTLRKDVRPSNLGDDYSKWMLDSARKAGDVTVIENAAKNGYYVLMFSSRSVNDYNVKLVRHILVKFTDSKSDSAKADDMKKIEEIYQTWKNGAATEDSFAALADEKSADSPKGGLYNVYRGLMVEPFENWCFDAVRKVGDTEIIETTYGYHLMYYAGEGELYCDMLGEAGLRGKEYEAWVDGMTKDYVVTQRAGMRLAK